MARTTKRTATPTNVVGKWDAEEAPIELRVRRAASSLTWYRRALKGGGLKPATREKYEQQVGRYEALLARLRAERDKARS